MQVSEILKLKGDAVFTVDADATLRQAAALLGERRVGAMVVMDPGGRVEGILSERDVARVVGVDGADALERPVAEIMTRDVVFADPSHSVDELLALMTGRRIRHLPVCRAGRLVGIVSIGDLVKAKIAAAEAEAADLKAYIAAG
jgi:CBS domain-containing protein